MANGALLLDDDPAFRRSLRPLLEGRGLAVREAATLAEATAALRETMAPWALLVAAAQLPDGSGIDWLRALEGPVRERPILVTSACWQGLREHREVQGRLASLPFVQLVHKPTGGSALDAHLEQIFSRANAPPLPPALAREMALLKAEYGEALSGKLGELRELVRRARAAPDDPAARKAARTSAHRLAGTAGSYGFPEESIAAAVVEAQALEVERAAPEGREAAWAVAESALDDALEALGTPVS